MEFSNFEPAHDILPLPVVAFPCLTETLPPPSSINAGSLSPSRKRVSPSSRPLYLQRRPSLPQ